MKQRGERRIPLWDGSVVFECITPTQAFSGQQERERNDWTGWRRGREEEELFAVRQTCSEAGPVRAGPGRAYTGRLQERRAFTPTQTVRVSGLQSSQRQRCCGVLDVLSVTRHQKKGSECRPIRSWLCLN